MGINIESPSSADLPMKIKLPELKTSGESRIEELIAKRRSVRQYKDKKFLSPLFLVCCGQLRA